MTFICNFRSQIYIASAFPVTPSKRCLKSWTAVVNGFWNIFGKKNYMQCLNNVEFSSYFFKYIFVILFWSFTKAYVYDIAILSSLAKYWYRWKPRNRRNLYMKITKLGQNFPRSRKIILKKPNFDQWRSQKSIPANKVSAFEVA